MIKRFLSYIVAAFAGTSVQAAPEPVKVLFIGNSYTHMNQMPKIFEKISKSKGENVLVEMDAKSSHTFKMHSEREELYKSIKKRKWDYVVLQGFSRELSHDQNHIDTASVPYFESLLDTIYQNNPCTGVMLYMTWGYKDGHSLRNDIDTYPKMTEKITKGYKYLSEKYNIPIAPVGHVWREVRGASDVNLYQPDAQHPTYHGSYISACTFYASIFRNSPVGAFSGTLNAKEAELIQETAYNYTYDNLENFGLNKQYAIVRPRAGQGKKEYLVDVEAIYPNASSILWNFGDKNTSDSAVASHQYKRHGSYNIELIIEDLCGPRRFVHTVSFKKSRRPWRKKSKENPKEMVIPGRTRVNE